jgi:hypothetical protein
MFNPPPLTNNDNLNETQVLLHESCGLRSDSELYRHKYFEIGAAQQFVVAGSILCRFVRLRCSLLNKIAKILEGVNLERCLLVAGASLFKHGHTQVTRARAQHTHTHTHTQIRLYESAWFNLLRFFIEFAAVVQVVPFWGGFRTCSSDWRLLLCPSGFSCLGFLVCSRG